MQTFASVDDIFKFAIAEEEAAEQFYLELAGKMKREHLQKVFQDFAAEERGHKAKLLAVKAGKISLLTDEMVPDLKITEYLPDISPEQQGQALDYLPGLIMAMKKEIAAFQLYTTLAENTANVDFQNLFFALAQEEAKHKLRLEIEYDDQFLNQM
jgi:rubrerythrin